jgi:hypothetical protein
MEYIVKTETKIAEEVRITELPRLHAAYAEARGDGVEIGQGYFDVYAQFKGGSFVGFRLEFTGT